METNAALTENTQTKRPSIKGRLVFPRRRRVEINRQTRRVHSIPRHRRTQRRRHQDNVQKCWSPTTSSRIIHLYHAQTTPKFKEVHEAMEQETPKRNFSIFTERKTGSWPNFRCTTSLLPGQRLPRTTSKTSEIQWRLSGSRVSNSREIHHSLDKHSQGRQHLRLPNPSYRHYGIRLLLRSQD